MSLYNFTDGEVTTAAQFNGNFNSLVLHKVDTTTDMNVSTTTTGTTTSVNKDYVFTSSEASKLGDYLLINMLGTFKITSRQTIGVGTSGSIGLTIRNTSTSTDIFNNSSFLSIPTNSADSAGLNYDVMLDSPVFLYAVTSSDRVNGMTINIKVDLTNIVGSSPTASYSNRGILFGSQNLVT